MADELTTHVRTILPPAKSATSVGTTSSSTEHALGKSWIVETQIHSRWGWISLPALVIILTVVFLAMTILQSKKRKLHAWKSSSLPLLYLSELDQNIQQDMRTLGNPVQVESLSEQVHVTLVKDKSTNDRWQLNSVDNVAH
jgi:hypothetical protein